MTHIIDNQELIDYPMNLLEFQKIFHDDTACLRYLERMRWPNGFVCSKAHIRLVPPKHENSKYCITRRSQAKISPN